MSKDKKTYRTLTEQEIRDYLEGKIRGKTAHELERHLLNDAFDREAVEGYETNNEIPNREQLEQLKLKVLHQKDRSQNLLKIAATVSLLLLSGLVAWYYLEKVGQDTPVAMNETTEEKIEVDAPKKLETPSRIQVEKEKIVSDVPEEAPADAFEIVEQDEELDQEYVMEQEQDEMPVLEPQSEVSITLDDQEENLDLAVEDMEVESVMESFESAEQRAVVRSRSKRIKETRAEPSAASALAMDEAVFGVSGQVTDDTGEPLPGVSVMVKGQSRGTVTDVDGNYFLQVDEDDVLQFVFIGMESAETPVEGRVRINMELEADVMALSEVVVVGYGVEKKSNLTGAVSSVDVEDASSSYRWAQPVGGTDDYKTYLDTAMVYPKEAEANGIEGKVVLKLTIDEAGRISDIEVRRSLGYGCDEEAIRLVKEGPSWQPAERDGQPLESTVRVRVKFDFDD